MPNSKIASEDEPGSQFWRSASLIRCLASCTTVPALPGCFTRGSTIDECRERAVEAIEVHIAGLRADGEPVPDEVWGTPTAGRHGRGLTARALYGHVVPFTLPSHAASGGASSAPDAQAT